MMASLLDRVRGADIPDDLGGEIPAGNADEFAPDPQPGKGAGRAAKQTSAARPRATATAKKALAAELDAYAKMIALAWSVSDEECAEVLNDTSASIAAALADLIGRNPALMKWVHQSGVISDWTKLFLVFKPLFSAVRRHHFSGAPREVTADDPPDLTRYPPYRPGG